MSGIAAQTWLILTRSCDVLASTWAILTQSSGDLTRTWAILTQTCVVLPRTWVIVAQTCDVLPRTVPAGSAPRAGDQHGVLEAEALGAPVGFDIVGDSGA